MPRLLRALSGPDETVQEGAGRALWEMGDREVAPALAAALTEGSGSLSEEAVEALDALGTKARASPPSGRWSSGTSRCRLRPPGGWGALRERSTVPALVKALQNYREGVRRSAAEALGILGGPEDLSALLAAQGDPKRRCRPRRPRDWESRAHAAGRRPGGQPWQPCCGRSTTAKGWCARTPPKDWGLLGEKEAEEALRGALSDGQGQSGWPPSGRCTGWDANSTGRIWSGS